MPLLSPPPSQARVHGARLALSVLAASVLASACSPAAPPGDRLAELAERYWAWYLESHPLSATYMGYEVGADRLPDVSAEARAARSARRRSFLRELEAIPRDGLDDGDRVTHRALEEELRTELAVEAACRFPLWRVNHRNGPPASLLRLAELQPLEAPDDGRAMVRRWRAMDRYLEARAANLRAGLEEGLVPPRRPVELTVRQLEETLEEPDSAWTLLDPLDRIPPSWPDSARARFRTNLRTTVAESVRPAFAAYRDVLRDEVLPAARTGGRIGVSELPLEGCYPALVRRHTSLELTSRGVHERGRSEIERIEAAIRRLGSRVLGTDDLREVQRRLREDPDLHFESAEGILAKAREATHRARDALPGAFGRLPEASIEVRPIPDHEAPYTTVAYYRRPAADGSRPGVYFVNTHAPETRTRYEAEALAFHEGIPGHHVQIALAQELEGLPAFRRHQGSTAFVEGWALYAERLADELGLYSSDLDRLGMLSYDAWRAARLVVDTGIHAFGWSRERAVRYMLDHTLLARNNVENEVDRYVAWPGQALAYKIGQQEILRLREEARSRLGEGFELAAFHDRVLDDGAVSLSLLRSEIEAWLASDDGPDAPPDG
jgi:uncharacterized protein (DUF885 family)